MRRRRLGYATVQWLVRVLARIFLGYRIEGLEHVPMEGACLLAANHKSYLDPPLIGSIFVSLA